MKRYSMESLMAEWQSAIACLSHDEQRALYAKSGSHLNRIQRAWRRYYWAKDRAHHFGMIGVGRYTFAEARLEIFCKRIGMIL
jgi:hypothetical protein